MRYRYYTADVFTDQPFGGNQLAVFSEARGLSAQRMQRITAEFNYSECTFVFPPEHRDHTRRVRIFTPAAELPFAGHPTVGTAFVLAAIGDVPLTGDLTRAVFEEGVGPVQVSVRSRQGRPYYSELTAARLPEYGPRDMATAPQTPDAAVFARVLSLARGDVLSDGKDYPQAISCGVPFWYVPLGSLDVLRRARINHDVWEREIAPLWAREIFLFSYQVERPGSTVHARMFAPALGIAEDPATGAAATALAGYLGARDPAPSGTLHWRVEQGIEMGRPSILEVEADKSAGALTAIRVGGASVLMCEGTLELP